MLGERCKQLLCHDIGGIFNFDSSTLGNHISGAVGTFGPRKAGALGESVKKVIIRDIVKEYLPPLFEFSNFLSETGLFSGHGGMGYWNGVKRR